MNLCSQEETAQGVSVTTTRMCAIQQLENVLTVSTTLLDLTVNAVRMEHGAMPHSSNVKVNRSSRLNCLVTHRKGLTLQQSLCVLLCRESCSAVKLSCNELPL